jgi:hypothetical protein
MAHEVLNGGSASLVYAFHETQDKMREAVNDGYPNVVVVLVLPWV